MQSSLYNSDGTEEPFFPRSRGLSGLGFTWWPEFLALVVLLPSTVCISIVTRFRVTIYASFSDHQIFRRLDRSEDASLPEHPLLGVSLSHSPRVLQDQVRDASPLSMPELRGDVLFDKGHAILPSPPPPSSL
jgi:hypothetical protein